MKIYFENGELSLKDDLYCGYNFKCDAKYGYSENEKFLDKCISINPNAIVYTNSLASLSSKYAWNKIDNDYDIYMRETKEDEFTKISNLYGGRIRLSQNVRKMFLSGCFGCR